MPESQRCVGILGLAIGGSFARAYHAAGWRVLALDTDADTLAIAMIDTVDGRLDAPASPIATSSSSPPIPRHAWTGLSLTPPPWGKLGETGALRHGRRRREEGAVRALLRARPHPWLLVLRRASHGGNGAVRLCALERGALQGAPMVLVPPAFPDPALLDLLDRAHTLSPPWDSAPSRRRLRRTTTASSPSPASSPTSYRTHM